MVDSIRLEVNVRELENKFKALPNLTKEEIITGMRGIIGKLDARIVRNIAERFTDIHSASRPAHVKLEDSLLGVVRAQGDLVIGELGFDLSATPHARILEMGGVIPAHAIRPKSAGALSFGKETLSAAPLFESEDADITVNRVIHPGAQIAAYHFMRDALLALQGVVGDDLAAGWQRAIMKAAF